MIFNSEPTAFQRALIEYLMGLPEKKRKRKFIVDCQRSIKGPLTADAIFESIKLTEAKSSQKTAKRVIRSALRPVVHVLKDYYSIVEALVSADPTPTAIIWAALKVVIDGADRFVSLFDTIKEELQSLTNYLQRITEYEWLYNDSNDLQDLLCKSYINILRFWHRVDKECDRSCFNALFCAISSFSTAKLRGILNNIKDNADQIEKLAGIIEAGKAKGERESAELERFKTEMERTAARKERQSATDWRTQQMADRQGKKVHCWLSSQKAYEANQSQYRAHKARRHGGTCEWLISDEKYKAWFNGSLIPSVIWLRGHPGSGKSTLCSSMIQSIERLDSTAAVAFHFYQFDQIHSTLETLRVIAGQLFEKLWNASRVISEDINKTIQGTSSSIENVQSLIKILVTNIPRAYFILDGLDEECEGSRWGEAQATLDFLLELSREFPRVRLAYSSQFRPCIDDKLRNFTAIEVQQAAEGDVTGYLEHSLNSLEIPDDDKPVVLENMKRKAEGNFLWATLMVVMIQEASSPKELKQCLEDGPSKLDEYYRRIFARFDKPHRLLASKIFSLIAYARRPLRLKELREAIGILQSSNPASLEDADLPFTRSVRKLFAPLIQIQNDSDDLEECTCRLFHSTVREFLYKNPDVLSEGTAGSNLRITPYLIFNACLLYLSQARYKQLLVRSDTRWMDSAGLSVDRHPFLFYSAKYWDKHVSDVDETKKLRIRVKRFLTSLNFQTCIQVQSLWVGGQFHIFLRNDQPSTNFYLRRIFPIWFFKPSEDDHLWRDYRAFMHEWRYLLQCGSCEHPKCHFLPYAGDIDRCFWGALGSQNFMSKFKGRYVSFMFQSEHNPSGQLYEGVSQTGDQLELIRLTARTQGKLSFIRERWTSRDNLPAVLDKTQLIETDTKTTNWSLYVECTGNGFDMRTGRAKPVSFSQDCLFLRIGCQIFQKDSEGDYVSLLKPGDVNDPHYPAYIEDFVSNRRYTILTTRRVITSDDVYVGGFQDKKIETFGTDLLKMEARLTAAAAFINSYNDIVKNADADADDESSAWSSKSSASDEAYESWSERATEESISQFEDDMITQWTGRALDFKRGPSESSDEAISTGSDASARDDTASSVPEIPPSAVIGYGRYRGDSSDGPVWAGLTDEDLDSGSDGDVPDIYTYYRHKKMAEATHPHNSIVVFDTSSLIPIKVFHFKRVLPFMIYDSPPAIHPFKPFLVWPLSDSDVFFADFMAKSYFIRKLRPSTSHTRHIFMKCHFSPCGRYLHIASLEGQRRPMEGRHGKAKNEKSPLCLALLLMTYRLSDSKTTRAPPVLIYRTRLELSSVSSLSVSRLPFTLTWTSDELYLTCSHSTLRVYRIRLFQSHTVNHPGPTNMDKGDGALVLQKTIFLPNTASRREVHYFPPRVGSTAVQIIIGSETTTKEPLLKAADNRFFGFEDETALCATDNVIGLKGILSPPIGCYFKPTDTGGWINANNLSEMPTDLGIGKLDQRLERFNPDDDCDLEPYII
ncbi:hypothetical protein BU17DRAFT_45376 [Hysterangium stoloniferum]|nr:hypothetical protein BU17DRAFT_45376 [Hysterangium stoloniferum]